LFYDKQKSVIYNHIIFLFSEIKTCDAKSCLIFLHPETTIYSAGFLFFKLKIYQSLAQKIIVSNNLLTEHMIKIIWYSFNICGKYKMIHLIYAENRIYNQYILKVL